MRISDWSSDVCSSDLVHRAHVEARDFRLPGRGGADAFFDRHIGRAACGEVDHDIRRLLDRPEEGLERFGRLIGSAIFRVARRSEEHTSELQSLMRISYAVFCLKKKNNETKLQESDNELQQYDSKQNY